MIAELAIAASCSWNNPGANPYRGSVPLAVHAYQDIPKAVRDKLQKRMEKHQYDEVVDIRRDEIVGKNEYIDLREMHFGNNQMCITVSRDKWKEKAVERGLIYCEEGHCLIVPTVCNNVSRVTRIKRMDPPPAAAAAPPSNGDSPNGIPLLPPVEVVTPTQAAFLPPMVTHTPEPASFSSQSGYPPFSDYPDIPYEPSGGGSNPGWYPLPPYIAPPNVIPPPYIEPPNVTPPPIPAVPEPSTWMMIMAGLGFLALKRRK